MPRAHAASLSRSALSIPRPSPSPALSEDSSRSTTPRARTPPPPPLPRPRLRTSSTLVLSSSPQDSSSAKVSRASSACSPRARASAAQRAVGVAGSAGAVIAAGVRDTRGLMLARRTHISVQLCVQSAKRVLREPEDGWSLQLFSTRRHWPATARRLGESWGPCREAVRRRRSAKRRRTRRLRARRDSPAGPFLAAKCAGYPFPMRRLSGKLGREV